MLGAVIGDMVGSIYEWDNIKKKDFPFFSSECFPTDDSIMTIAVAKAILENYGQFEGLKNKTIEWIQKIGRQYPNCGYGGRFKKWIRSDEPKPYLSFGNGSAMRVSACGWAGDSLEEVQKLSYAVTVITHDHPQGLKGAEATACTIFLARTGHSKDEIRAFIEENYYELDITLDEIRPFYHFDVTCQGTVPYAIRAFLESDSFEDAIRNAISIGGDSDTLAAITGSIAEAFYGIPDELREQAIRQFKLGSMLHYPQATVTKDPDLLSIIEQFEERYQK